MFSANRATTEVHTSPPYPPPPIPILPPPSELALSRRLPLLATLIRRPNQKGTKRGGSADRTKTVYSMLSTSEGVYEKTVQQRHNERNCSTSPHHRMIFLHAEKHGTGATHPCT
eukprot:1744743-Rhodomonas_salina.1